MRSVWFVLQYEKVGADDPLWALEAYHIAELNKNFACILKEFSWM